MSNPIQAAFFAAVKPQEIKVAIGGVELVVRQMPTAADTEALRDGQDALYKFIVRCAFDADGQPVFTDDDIPALKAAAKTAMLPLIKAVSDVNGFGSEDTAKNSAASPAAS